MSTLISFLKKCLSYARPADAERHFLAEDQFSLLSFDGVLTTVTLGKTIDKQM